MGGHKRMQQRFESDHRIEMIGLLDAWELDGGKDLSLASWLGVRNESF
jgi:hypothetical protein